MFRVWLLTAALLGLCLTMASLDRRPLDDPNLVFQRPGFLDAHGEPFGAPKVGEMLPAVGSRLVLFFVRPEQVHSLERALLANATLFRNASLAVAVAGQGGNQESGRILWLSDPSARAAAGFHMPEPRDGGPPVGYAIVDTAGMVRYRTLDSTMAERLKEVETMLRATP